MKEQTPGAFVLVVLGLHRPVTVWAMAAMVAVGGFLISLVDQGRMTENVATVIVLCLIALVAFVSYLAGMARVGELQEHARAAAPRGRPGRDRAPVQARHSAAVGAAGAMGLVAGSSMAQVETEQMMEPMVNVDGTPMMGDVDIHGNPYGVVDMEPISMDLDMGSMGGFDDSMH